MRNRSTFPPATTRPRRNEHQPLPISSDEEVLNRVADYMDWLNGISDETPTDCLVGPLSDEQNELLQQAIHEIDDVQRTLGRHSSQSTLRESTNQFIRKSNDCPR